MIICCCFQTFKELLDYTLCPFFNWECKGNGLYFITKIYLNFYSLFSFEKTPFFNWECKSKSGEFTHQI